MAGTIKGITIEIEGKTSPLVKSLQDVESQIKKDDAALKNLDKALQLDPTNVDLLAAKEAVLADKTAATTQKMEILQQVQADALSDLPEDSALTAAQMAELEAEIATTGSTLSELSGEADGASGDLEEVGDSAEEAGQEVEDSSESFEGLGEAAAVAGEVAVGAMEAVAVAAAAVGTAAVAAGTAMGTAFVNATMETSKLADEIGTLSSVTGLSTDTIQELNYASELLDVDTQTVTGSMTKLLKSMSSAAAGSESAQKKFSDLGISIYDTEGNLRSTEDVFWDVVDVLGTYQNEAERDAAAMEIFGRSARELNPLIEAGSDTFRQLASEAQAVGYVMSSETVDAFGALDDNMVRMTNTAQAVEQSFGQVLLPLLTDMSGDAVDLMGDFSGALSGAGGDIDAIAGIIEQFAPRAVDLVEKYIPKILTVVESVFGALIPLLGKIAPQIIVMLGNLLQSVAGSIAENSDDFVMAFNSLFESVVQSAMTLLPTLIPLAISIIETLVTTLLDPANIQMIIDGALSIIMSLTNTLTNESNLMMMINAATTLIMSLLEGLTSALPVLIPAALDAVLTVVDTLLSSGCLAQIISAALTLILTLANSLIEYLPRLISRLPEIIIGIVEFLTGDALPDIINAGVVLLTSLVTHLPEIIVAVVEALIELVAGMCEYITTDGAEDLAKNFLAVFGALSEDAVTWGKDIIQGLIDGIGKMIGNLTKKVSSVAKTIADYLHFSVPDKGPLADFDTSGADMVEEFIDSMNSKQSDLQKAVNSMANVIGSDTDYNLATQSHVQQTVDYTGGLSRIEQAITGSVAASGASEATTMIFPIYIGGEHIDTIVLDAADRNNYLTGGH